MKSVKKSGYCGILQARFRATDFHLLIDSELRTHTLLLKQGFCFGLITCPLASPVYQMIAGTFQTHQPAMERIKQHTLLPLFLPAD